MADFGILGISVNRTLLPVTAACPLSMRRFRRWTGSPSKTLVKKNNKDELRTTTFIWGRLMTFSDGGERRQSQQRVFNLNSHKPAGLGFLAIDHLAQEAIVVIIDRHNRGVLKRLVEPDLGPAFADVSDLTVKNLASCSKYTHRGGLI